MTPTGFVPVEHIPADDPKIPGLVLVCDHASNAVPPWVTPLGLSAEDMSRHIAWDVGARGVTLALARLLGAPAILSTWSRLVIDPNRGPKDPTLVMKIYDGSIIEGNRAVGKDETQRRLAALHQPYHDAIDHAIEAEIDAGHEPVLLSMHSFTPQLRGRAPRPWEIALLWDQDDRLLWPLMKQLRMREDLTIGNNEPYTGRLGGDSMWTHGTMRDIPHVLVEIRNDLIEAPEGQTGWAELLAPMLQHAVTEMRLAETGPMTQSDRQP